MLIKRLIIITLLLALLPVATMAAEDETPPKIGNFIVPDSQQPGALISFGENIIDKNEKQIDFFTNDYAGVDKHFIDSIPGFIYGVTDNVSVFVTMPIALSYKEGHNRSAGLEDSAIQLEYAFYNHSTKCYVDQATIVTTITIPTGSVHKNPNTGIGAPSFFLGFTFERIYADWFFLTSHGTIHPMQHAGTKFGNSFLYQFGLGRNIMDINGWVLAWLTELTGTYSERNQLFGVRDPNSGGNVIYFTPSFWASNKNIIFQLGVGYPVQQHLFGAQTRETYVIVSDFRWSFF